MALGAVGLILGFIIATAAMKNVKVVDLGIMKKSQNQIVLKAVEKVGAVEAAGELLIMQKVTAE